MRTITKKKINYRRVSTEYQFTATQGQACNAYIANNPGNWEVIEETVSGRKMTGRRLQELRALVENGEVQEILVYSLDRLGRNVVEGLRFIDLCVSKSTKVTSLLEPFEFTTPEGRMFLTHTLASAEFLCGRLSRNTKEGLKRAGLTCKKCGLVSVDKEHPACTHETPRFVGGSGKDSSWMSAKTLAKLPSILKYLDKGLAHRDIKKLVGCDERTVRRIAQTRDDLPQIRERVWDQ